MNGTVSTPKAVISITILNQYYCSREYLYLFKILTYENNTAKLCGMLFDLFTALNHNKRGEMNAHITLY